MASVRETDRQLDALVEEQMDRLAVPGVAVGILRGRGRHVNGYGVTNVDHPQPVDATTLFQIGSTTKTYTATAIMRLVQQRKVRLDVPVRRYLPELRLRNADAQRKATLEHLLTHTGGWMGDFFEDGGRGGDALANVVSMMRKVKQLTPLGEVWSYNNSGFYIAGRVIEKVTKSSYEDAIAQLLFEPLGMQRSYFFPEDVMTSSFAAGHVTERKKARVTSPWALHRSVNPAGGIISDAADQLVWASFHMGDGKAPDGKRLLRQSLLRRMQRPQAEAGSLADHVGISWLLRTVDGVKLVAHGGTTNGQLSAFVMAPERSFAITVLTNSTTGGQLHRAVVDWALEHYIGVRRPEIPKVKLPREELEAYAGTYNVESSGMSFEVEAKGGGIVVKLPAPAATPNGRTPPAPPPIRMYFVSPDRVAAVDGPLKGTYGEFLRGPRGDIRWFRLGGRIQRRAKKPASAARKTS